MERTDWISMSEISEKEVSAFLAKKADTWCSHMKDQLFQRMRDRGASWMEASSPSVFLDMIQQQMEKLEYSANKKATAANIANLVFMYAEYMEESKRPHISIFPLQSKSESE